MVLATKKPKRPHAASKQRDARHHRKDEHYLKPYWPYIPMVLLVVLGLTFSSLWSHVQHGVLGYATSMNASSLLQGNNTQRSSNGLGGLTYNNTLAQAAQAKANDMASRNYWSHNTPDGAAPWTFITNAGYSYTTAGENLAYGFDTSDATTTGWMGSPAHKANILNSAYTEVGYGIANSADFQGTGPQTIVVAMYASPRIATPAPIPAAPAPVQPQTAQTEPAPAPETPTTAAPTPEAKPQAAEQTAEKPKESNATANSDAIKPPAATAATDEQNISRIQLAAANQASWSMFAVTSLATVAIVVFFLRHALFWHRALVKGEAFFIRHKLFDIGLVGAAVIGYILTRSAGVIH